MWWQSQMSGKSLSATWLQYTFTSSNLTCYHAEFVNSGQFFLPPLFSANWPSCHAKFLECAEIPGGLLAAQGSPTGGKSGIIHHTTEACLFCKQLCWERRAACHRPSVVSVPTAPRPDSGTGNQVNAMHRQIIPCKACLTKTLRGAGKLCLGTYCST